jgi:hypothetical protein
MAEVAGEVSPGVFSSVWWADFPEIVGRHMMIAEVVFQWACPGALDVGKIVQKVWSSTVCWFAYTIRTENLIDAKKKAGDVCFAEESRRRGAIYSPTFCWY